VGTPLIKRYGNEAIQRVRHWWANRVETPYIVADKMDRRETEVAIAASAGADAVVALGHPPTETLTAFVAACERNGVDAFIDMMNVSYPLSVLRALPQLTRVVLLHRGVDEERFNKEKQLPLYEIRRIKSNYPILIGFAGGDMFEEARRAAFNDADIVVVWKSFYSPIPQQGNR
jgi:3-keto-L-gulonate-6-phosphate decarboxylase